MNHIFKYLSFTLSRRLFCENLTTLLPEREIYGKIISMKLVIVKKFIVQGK